MRRQRATATTWTAPELVPSRALPCPFCGETEFDVSDDLRRVSQCSSCDLWSGDVDDQHVLEVE